MAIYNLIQYIGCKTPIIKTPTCALSMPLKFITLGRPTVFSELHGNVKCIVGTQHMKLAHDTVFMSLSVS